MCIGSTEHYEGSFEGRDVLGARARYEYRLPSGFFVGASGGFESIDRYKADTSVFLLGPTVGGRWGDRVRGGVRFAAGPAYAYDPRWQDSRASNTHVTGFFFDLTAEFAVHVGDNVELFVEPSIASVRSFAFPNGPNGHARWSYAMAVLPLMLNSGVRVPF